MKQLETLLNQASQEKRDALAKLLPPEIFKKGEPASTEKIIKAIRWAHDDSILRTAFAAPKSYLEILQSVAKHLEINLPVDENNDAAIEQRICQKVMTGVLAKMDDSQRAAFIAAIDKEYGRNSSFIGTGGVAATLAAGKLGGFSTYMLASSGLAAVSGAAGLTLPFAAYTGLSTALGTVLGPAGWISLGLFALLKSRGPSYDKLIAAILYIAMLRNEPADMAVNT
ncbi:hypothetical protein [Noviherbaspirillum sp.]|uniref:hypothetical protein n=1 Tax=Noviherbaspirillum sp. TaxID=1926288 RepID=UPI002FE33842